MRSSKRFRSQVMRLCRARKGCSDDRNIVRRSGNTASVVAVFQRLGASCRLVQTVPEVDDSESLVLPVPGIWTCHGKTANLGIAEPLRRRVLEGRPTLGICLGMQLMPNRVKSLLVTGLSCFEGTVTPLNTVNTPQFGWNEIALQNPGTFLNEGGMVYFANSYRLKDAPNGWVSARCEYGGVVLRCARSGCCSGVSISS